VTAWCKYWVWEPKEIDELGYFNLAEAELE
jgi:hypothetical protein